jgi:hypothetical protein
MKPRSILLAGALLAAAPAHAATYIITYEGTVANSYDNAGIFGGSGSSLDGLDFTAVYTLTDPLPGALSGGDGSTYASTYGGSSYSAPSPVSATLTINGITQALSGYYYSFAEQYNDYGGSLDRVWHKSQGTTVVNGYGTYDYIYNYISSSSNDFLSSIDYTSQLSYTTQSGDVVSGSFRFSAPHGSSASGYLRPTSVTIAALASGVPEPATWALTILGFGLVGGVMRRQRRKVRLGYG